MGRAFGRHDSWIRTAAIRAIHAIAAIAVIAATPDARAQTVTPLGGELLVNTHTPGGQRASAVAMDCDGDFVVAWSSSLQDGAAEGVFARRFASSGAGLGVELQVNLHTTGAQTSPSLVVDGEGGFVVAWASESDGYDFGVLARRFDSAGSPRGGELQVNVRTEDVEDEPSLAIGPNGGFVVVWTRTGGDRSDTPARVFARLFDAKGVPRTAEIPVPPVVPVRSQRPSVSTWRPWT